MTMPLVGVVLAAGTGTRLQPLTSDRPKALCPVANVALVDYALARVRSSTDEVVVNAWHHADQLVRHLEGHAPVAVELGDQPLGTAGGLAALRERLDGRAVLVHNADAWHSTDLSSFVRGWDGDRSRLLVTPASPGQRVDFLPNYRFTGVSLMPWHAVRSLPSEPSGLWEVSWRQAWEDGSLELVEDTGIHVDCSTPSSYLLANLVAARAWSVAGERAVVRGTLRRSVVWDGAEVLPGERLVEVVRSPTATVPAPLSVFDRALVRRARATCAEVQR